MQGDDVSHDIKLFFWYYIVNEYLLKDINKKYLKSHIFDDQNIIIWSFIILFKSWKIILLHIIYIVYWSIIEHEDLIWLGIKWIKEESRQQVRKGQIV